MISVEIPTGSSPGSEIRFTAPNGVEMSLIIPGDARPGDVVQVEAPPLPQQAATSTVATVAMDVQVPFDALPGQKIQFSAPDGTVLQVEVSATDAPPGATLRISLENGQATIAPVATTQRSARSIAERNSKSGVRSATSGGFSVSASQQKRRRNTIQEAPEKPKMRPEELDPLDYPDGDFQCVRASLHSTLRFDDLVAVVHMTGDTVMSCDLEHVAPILFDLIATDGKDSFSLAELERGVSTAAVQELVQKTGCKVLRQLIKDKDASREKAFKKIDDDGDGCIQYAEWMQFLVEVRNLRLRYFRRICLLKNRLYSGFGLEPGEPASTSCACVVPRGYTEDLWHYARNNHPLLMMFMASDDHYFGGVS